MFDLAFFGTLALGSIEFARPGTFKKTFVKPLIPTFTKVGIKLKPLGLKVLKAKRLAVPAIPVEISLLIGGELFPEVPLAGQQAIISGLKDKPITTVFISSVAIATLSVGLAALSVTLLGTPGVLGPVATGIAASIVLELVIA